jgi:hypothetical protein
MRPPDLLAGFSFLVKEPRPARPTKRSKMLLASAGCLRIQSQRFNRRLTILLPNSEPIRWLHLPKAELVVQFVRPHRLHKGAKMHPSFIRIQGFSESYSEPEIRSLTANFRPLAPRAKFSVPCGFGAGQSKVEIHAFANGWIDGKEGCPAFRDHIEVQRVRRGSPISGSGSAAVLL